MNLKVHLPVLLSRPVQPVKHIMEKIAAGFAVDVMAIASFPELPQITCIFHNL